MGKIRTCGIWLTALLALGLLSGCATTNTEGDPLEPLNRTFYNINDTLDKGLLKPVAKVYSKYTPKPIRTGITNFFDNLGLINTVANDILQGKVSQALSDSARFVFNSTLGVGGLFDIATGMGLEHHKEDLGQTFGVWGFGEGAYLNLPFKGPNSVRDAPDLVTSAYLNPIYYLNAVVTIPLAVLDGINTRANLLEATNVVEEAALDPYIFTREAYRQRRIYDIYDGEPPLEEDFNGNLDEEEEGVLSIE